MKISKEEFAKELRDIHILLQRAGIIASELSNKIGDFDYSKPINILMKEIDEIDMGILWFLGYYKDELSDVFEEGQSIHIPKFAEIGKPIRDLFKGDKDASS